MSAAGRYGRAAFWGGGIILLGYGIMKAATPSDEQFYKALSPDLRRKVDDYRKVTEHDARYEQLKAAAESGEPVFQDTASGKLIPASERRR